MYSGKYEGGMCVFPEPHIISVSNHRPDTSKLSEDRWSVKCTGTEPILNISGKKPKQYD